MYFGKNLKPGEERIIEALEDGPLRFKDLRERAELSPPALSPYLKNLTRKHIVLHNPETKMYKLAKAGYYANHLFEGLKGIGVDSETLDEGRKLFNIYILNVLCAAQMRMFQLDTSTDRQNALMLRLSGFDPSDFDLAAPELEFTSRTPLYLREKGGEHKIHRSRKEVLSRISEKLNVEKVKKELDKVMEGTHKPSEDLLEYLSFILRDHFRELTDVEANWIKLALDPAFIQFVVDLYEYEKQFKLAEDRLAQECGEEAQGISKSVFHIVYPDGYIVLPVVSDSFWGLSLSKMGFEYDQSMKLREGFEAFVDWWQQKILVQVASAEIVHFLGVNLHKVRQFHIITQDIWLRRYTENDT